MRPPFPLLSLCSALPLLTLSLSSCLSSRVVVSCTECFICFLI